MCYQLQIDIREEMMFGNEYSIFKSIRFFMLLTRCENEHEMN